MLRGAIPPARLAPLLADLIDYFGATLAADLETGVLAARRRSGVVPLDQAVAAGYRGLLAIVPAIAASRIGDTLRAYFADAVHASLHSVLLRHYHAGNGYKTVAAFHQDVSGADPRATVTSWIPLVACGVDAPGLEFVDDAVDAPLADIGEAGVLARYGAGLAHPAFEAGDAVLLRNTVPHRSYVTAAMTKPRYSIDLRYIPAAAITAADPLDALPSITVGRGAIPASSSRASRTARGP